MVKTDRGDREGDHGEERHGDRPHDGAKGIPVHTFGETGHVLGPPIATGLTSGERWVLRILGALLAFVLLVGLVSVWPG
jgi:hypothetical protein